VTSKSLDSLIEYFCPDNEETRVTEEKNAAISGFFSDRQTSIKMALLKKFKIKFS
jgi:hypothetical protein